MPSLGAGEIIVIFVLVLVLFGPNRLPELARGLGKATREVRKITSEFQSQLAAITDIDDEEKPAARIAKDSPPALEAPQRLDQMRAETAQWTPHEDALPLEDSLPVAEVSAAQPADPEQGTLDFSDSDDLDDNSHLAQRMDSPHA